jgi:hypothetical protein
MFFGVFPFRAPFTEEGKIPHCPVPGTKFIDQLRALADKQSPCAMERQQSLLLNGLYCNKPHRRTGHGFTNRLRIDRIRLAALNVWFDIYRWDQPNIMAQRVQFPGSMMRAAAGFHTNQAGLNPGEEQQQLCPSQRSVEGDLFVFCDPVNLKNVLGQVEADCCNLHGVAPLICSL